MPQIKALLAFSRTALLVSFITFALCELCIQNRRLRAAAADLSQRRLHPLSSAAGGKNSVRTAVGPVGVDARQRLIQSDRPLLTSHFWITSAIWSLFFACIRMWELPLMPMSGRSIHSALPPALLMAYGEAMSSFLKVAQRGCRST